MRCVKYSVKRAERKETDGSPDGRLGPDELSRHLCHCFFHLVEKLQKILCASSLSGRDFLAVSVSSNGEGANLENRVSSSSGSSTFVMMSTMESDEDGIASIISGISSASNPNSKAACCIISWKSDFAFSVP